MKYFKFRHSIEMKNRNNNKTSIAYSTDVPNMTSCEQNAKVLSKKVAQAECVTDGQTFLLKIIYYP